MTSKVDYLLYGVPFERKINPVSISEYIWIDIVNLDFTKAFTSLFLLNKLKSFGIDGNMSNVGLFESKLEVFFLTTFSD